MNKKLFDISVEMLLILVVSAAIGVGWNWTLLTSAWRGAPLPQARQAQSEEPKAPAQAEQLPMPIALMQVKESYDAKEAVIVDARSAEQYAEAHIAGAISLPLAEASKSPLKVKLPKDGTIIVYCNGFSCPDSMDLGKILMKAGYANVYIFEGGLPEWRDAGYPVAKGAK